MGTRKPEPIVPRVTQCSRCKAPIVWARTVASGNGPGGKAMPLDAYPDPAGNVAARVTDRRRSIVLARVLGKDETHDHRVEVLAMPHFASCGVTAGQQLADDVEAFLATQTTNAGSGEQP